MKTFVVLSLFIFLFSCENYTTLKKSQAKINLREDVSDDPADDNNIPPIDANYATWNSVVKFLGPKCIVCHNPEGSADFSDLSTRQAFFEQRKDLLNNFEDVENSYIMELIQDDIDPMPPKDSAVEKLSEQEVAELLEWIKKGVP